MKSLDEATLERIVEQITRQVLILVQEEQEKAAAGGTGAPSISAHNYVEHVQPVVSAGADRVATTLGVAPTDGRLAPMIDHTLLKPDATQDQIAQLCYEARKFHFASVCVNPVHVPRCAEALRGSAVKVCTVIGFPLGANTSVVKAFEAVKAIQDGATELDMVINVGALKAGDLAQVRQDIRQVVEAARASAALVKVIIEACLLTDEEKVTACQLAKQAGADYVKTSTGFSTGGAMLEDVVLMRRTVGPEIGVKAAGGIRTLADAQRMIQAGASLLGASAGVKILLEMES